MAFRVHECDCWDQSRVTVDELVIWLIKIRTKKVSFDGSLSFGGSMNITGLASVFVLEWSHYIGSYCNPHAYHELASYTHNYSSNVQFSLPFRVNVIQKRIRRSLHYAAAILTWWRIMRFCHSSPCRDVIRGLGSSSIPVHIPSGVMYDKYSQRPVCFLCCATPVIHRS